MDLVSDEELVKKSRIGDMQAFNELLIKYEKKVAVAVLVTPEQIMRGMEISRPIMAEGLDLCI
jgi:hypothetical protein